MRRLVKLTFVSLAAFVLCAGVPAASLFASETPVVTDATGAIIGPYINGQFVLVGENGENSSIPDAALREIDGYWFTLAVTSLGFVNSGATLNYPTTDCSGPAYAPAISAGNTKAPPLKQLGQVYKRILYYADVSASPISFSGGSQLALFSNGSTKCGALTTELTGQFPVKTFDLSTLGFRPPFSLAIELE
jgi:hypothetical protein